MTSKKTFAALLAVVLAVFAGTSRMAQGAPAAAPPAYLVYSGGLFGQLEPCG